MPGVLSSIIHVRALPNCVELFSVGSCGARAMAESACALATKNENGLDVVGFTFQLADQLTDVRKGSFVSYYNWI